MPRWAVGTPHAKSAVGGGGQAPGQECRGGRRAGPRPRVPRRAVGRPQAKRAVPISPCLLQTEYTVKDLNEDPKLPYEDNSFDVITNAGGLSCAGLQMLAAGASFSALACMHRCLPHSAWPCTSLVATPLSPLHSVSVDSHRPTLRKCSQGTHPSLACSNSIPLAPRY